jgi:DNA-binding CsgD family transcriptional regulator/tetratricopeptide (TPR) repeat protein
LWDLRGRITEAVDWFEPLLMRAPEPSAARAVALVQLAAHKFMLGEQPEALLDEAIELSRARGYFAPHLHALTGKCAVALASADVVAAQRFGDEALSVARLVTGVQGSSFAYYWRGSVALARGALDEARALTREGLELARCDDDRYASATLLLLAGQAAIQQGAHSTASVHLREALQILRGMRAMWIHSHAIDLLAVAEQALGNHAMAVRLLAASDQLRGTVGMVIAVPLWKSVVDATIAATRAQLGDAGFETAWAEGRADLVWENVESLLDAAVAPPTAPHSAYTSDSEGSALDTLTARERQVAGLIGRGMTSREIARALVISVKTADTHAGRLREKLGLRSRAEIAIWAVRNATSGQ